MLDPQAEAARVARVRQIARRTLGEDAAEVVRFTTGACNHVYDVATASGRRVAVRMASDDGGRYIRAGVTWSAALRPLGVPLPALLAHSPPHETPAWMVLDRLPGDDLGAAYPLLTVAQKEAIAHRVADAQERARRLPLGTGFGFAQELGGGPKGAWGDVVRDTLDEARQRILAVGAVGPRHVDRVADRLPAFEGYFSRVYPLPFLDDTTTRNVIVDAGRFTGIVDVDSVCYGDPLYVVGLTAMALRFRGQDTGYIDAWLDRLDADEERRRAARLYTAVFGVAFLGELGQRFNRDEPAPVNPAEVEVLVG